MQVLRSLFWEFCIYIVGITMQLPFQMVGWEAQDAGVLPRLFGIVPIVILAFVREW